MTEETQLEAELRGVGLPPELLRRLQGGNAGTPIRGGPSPLVLGKLMWAASHAHSMEAAISIARAVRWEIADWVDRYAAHRPDGFQTFERDWSVVRRVLPLQVVLIVEQVLYDKDEPWRSLVGGFKPIMRRTR